MRRLLLTRSSLSFLASLSLLTCAAARAEDEGPPDIVPIQAKFPAYIEVKAVGDTTVIDHSCEGSGCTSDNFFRSQYYIGLVQLINLSPGYVRLDTHCSDLSHYSADQVLLTPAGTDYIEPEQGEHYSDMTVYFDDCTYKPVKLTRAAALAFIDDQRNQVRNMHIRVAANQKWYDDLCAAGRCPTPEEYDAHSAGQ